MSPGRTSPCGTSMMTSARPVGSTRTPPSASTSIDSFLALTRIRTAHEHQDERQPALRFVLRELSGRDVHVAYRRTDDAALASLDAQVGRCRRVAVDRGCMRVVLHLAAPAVRPFERPAVPRL